MKKIILTVSMLSLLLLTGCTKVNESGIKEKFLKDTEKLNSYYMEGELKLTNNDDTYTYNVEVSFSKEDNFKVVMTNVANNYQQTILRNDEAVYVLTPAINKNFKFQSEWPYNNSQSYLLSSLANDIKNDKTSTVEKQNDQYVIKSKVNYPNNPSLDYEKITLDKNYDLQKVEVFDKDNIPMITFNVKNIDKKAKFKSDYFSYEEQLPSETETPSEEANENSCPTDEDCTTTSKTIDESLFPLYLPANTTLSNKEVIDTETGQRVIMTFQGDSPFILVQETVSKEPSPTIIPTYGEPFILVDTIGSLTDISYTWASNGIEYYIVSDVLNQNELLEIAKSINVVSVINEK